MAFPSSNRDDLASAWAGIRVAAGRIKTYAQSLKTASAAGSIQAGDVVSFVDQLASSNDTLARYTAVPGLVEYVRAQIDNAAVDIVAEYSTMLAQINATRNWVLTNFPKDADGYLLYHKFDAAGRISQRTFSPAETAGLRTQLDALLATID